MTSSSETEFTGKRALVTGGTRGMGEAIVQRLRGSGATVVTTARSTPRDLLQPDLFVDADLSTAAGTEKVVSYVRDRLGGVDILVNNVGGSSAPGGGFAALTDEEWQQALNQNLLAAVRLDRVRGDARLCSREGRVDDVQQGAFERSRTEGRPGRERGARLHTNHRGNRTDRPTGGERRY
jgi:NAD(P)-dependent dehydrogenase (short-subunit alcohol dehydrogenase family)